MDLRALLRDVVDERVPAVAICLGSQIAAEALGGVTAVPSPHGGEGGVVELARVFDRDRGGRLVRGPGAPGCPERYARAGHDLAALLTGAGPAPGPRPVAGGRRS